MPRASVGTPLEELASFTAKGVPKQTLQYVWLIKHI